MSRAARVRRMQRALRLALRERGQPEVVLAGICMRPLLPPGAPLRLELRPPRRGEVVVYETAEGWVAHRVVGVGEQTLLTRADRPGAGVERVDRARVVGVWSQRSGGRIPRAGLVPEVGRAAQRVSHMLSGPRILPLLRTLRDRAMARRPRPRALGVRRLETLGRAEVPGLSALGLYRDAEVINETGLDGAEPPVIFLLESERRRVAGGGPVIRGGLRVDLNTDPDAARAGLVQIAIVPGLRGRGLGRALLQAAVAWAKSEGLQSLHAEIARNNHPSRALFLAAGFRLLAPGTLVHPGRGALIDAYRLLLAGEGSSSCRAGL